MPKGKGRQDPLGIYFEWVQHRYDPGHYLGGTIEPDLRKSSLGNRARRRSGMLLVFSGVLGLLLLPAYALGFSDGSAELYERLTLALGAAVSMLTVAAGVSMVRASVPQKRRRR